MSSSDYTSLKKYKEMQCVCSLSTTTNSSLTDDVVTLTGIQTLTNKLLTSPTLTTPSLGVATATSINKLIITHPDITANLVIGNGTVFTTNCNVTHSGNYSQTFVAVADSSLVLPMTGTLSTLSGTETLTNKTLTSPILTTPSLGVATATSINKLIITNPGTTANLVIGNGTIFKTSGNVTYSGNYSQTFVAVADSSLVLPVSGILSTLSGNETLTNKILASPILTTPSLGVATATSIISGNITIGSSLITTYPLYISLTNTSSELTARYLKNNDVENAVAIPVTPNSFGIFSEGAIVSNAGFFATSDERIKKQISDILDISAIDIIRNIKPKQFNFIDYKNECREPVWGFIAQDIKNIIPNSVSLTINYIPNIYDIALLECSNKIKLSTKTTKDLLMNENLYYKLKIIDEKNKEIIVTIKNIIDDNTFEINDILNIENTNIFVYGQEVDDFHVLDKNMIYTITTASVKELDNELQNTKNRLLELERENNTLKQQITYIYTKLSDINI